LSAHQFPPFQSHRKRPSFLWRSPARVSDLLPPSVVITLGLTLMPPLFLPTTIPNSQSLLPVSRTFSRSCFLSSLDRPVAVIHLMAFAMRDDRFLDFDPMEIFLIIRVCTSNNRPKPYGARLKTPYAFLWFSRFRRQAPPLPALSSSISLMCLFPPVVEASLCVQKVWDPPSSMIFIRSAPSSFFPFFLPCVPFSFF